MRAAALLPFLVALSACDNQAPEPEPVETEVPKDLAQSPPPVVAAEDSIGTPMAERVATLGLLNKRNNISQELEMKAGETRRIGNVIVRLSACEKTAPWETVPEEGAFVQVLVQERADANRAAEWRRVFSGWLFKNSPSLNVVEHPIYDVWVKSCEMSFPGEGSAAESSANPSGSGNAPAPAPAPRAAPSPIPTPTATPEPADAGEDA
jgi:hypothetical protein